MFTIGDFATFTAVSVPALRLWNRLGLLEPASVDPATGYRRYRADQAMIVHRIVALKSLGFTLAQIKPLLENAPAREQLQGMLALRRAEAEDEHQRAAERLAMIEARLLILERSTSVVQNYEVVRKVSPAVRLAVLERHLDLADDDPARLFGAFGELFAELGQRLGAAGIAPIGPAWSLYERSDESGLVIHAALPVAASHVDDRVQVIDRPPLAVAATIHAGDVREMGLAYAAIMEWIEANRLEPVGGSVEISLVWDPEHLDANVTELQLPITGA